MKHFRFSEFVYSPAALKQNIDNRVTNPRYMANICALVDNVLDPLRDIVHMPIYINSGYRCAELNRLVGGSDNSQHLRGLAADISFGRNEYLCEWVYDVLKTGTYPMFEHIDQCILYINKRFIHVSIAERENIPRHMFFYKL